MVVFKLGQSLVESGKLGMQSLDFPAMRIGSNSFPPPLYTHESLPCCAHAFVNPVCGWKRKNPRRTWADRRADRLTFLDGRFTARQEHRLKQAPLLLASHRHRPASKRNLPAIVLDLTELQAEQMQAIATKFNYSKTTHKGRSLRQRRQAVGIVAGAGGWRRVSMRVDHFADSLSWRRDHRRVP
jgi:hypothetical protein